jgi:hypothetical protein
MLLSNNSIVQEVASRGKKAVIAAESHAGHVVIMILKSL